MQSARALSFYLEEIHQLGSELSLSRQNVDVSRDAPGPGRPIARPVGAPTGRTLPPAPSPGIYARLVATARALHHPEVLRHPRGRRRALCRCRPAPGRGLTCSTTRSRSTAPPSWRMGTCMACGAQSASSAFIWRSLRSCGRTPRSTNARSGSCWEAACPGTDYTSLTEAARIAKLLGVNSQRHGCWGLPVPRLIQRKRNNGEWQSSPLQQKCASCTVRQR